jgi:hypothetical protein
VGGNVKMIDLRYDNEIDAIDFIRNIDEEIKTIKKYINSPNPKLVKSYFNRISIRINEFESQYKKVISTAQSILSIKIKEVEKYIKKIENIINNYDGNDENHIKELKKIVYESQVELKKFKTDDGIFLLYFPHFKYRIAFQKMQMLFEYYKELIDMLQPLIQKSDILTIESMSDNNQEDVDKIIEPIINKIEDKKIYLSNYHKKNKKSFKLNKILTKEKNTFVIQSNKFKHLVFLFYYTKSELPDEIKNIIEVDKEFNEFLYINFKQKKSGRIDKLKKDTITDSLSMVKKSIDNNSKIPPIKDLIPEFQKFIESEIENFKLL